MIPLQALGVGIMGIGVRIVVEKDNFLAIFGFSLMSSAAAAIIVVGSLVVLVAVCGIAAVIIRNKCLMLMVSHLCIMYELEEES